MNIQINLYEFFGNLIPGSVYMIAYLSILDSTNILNYQIILFLPEEYHWPLLLAALILAYILGFLMDTIVSSIFFQIKKQDQYVDENFRRKIVDLGHTYKKVNHHHAYALFGKLRLENLEVANTIERDKVLSITLRNIGAAFSLLAIDQFIRLVTIGYNIINLVLCLTFLLLSFLAFYRSAKFIGFFFAAIAETYLGKQTEVDTLLGLERK